MPTLLERLGIVRPPVKAATGAGVVAMTTLPSLTTLFGHSPQDRMAAYLKAYKVGWFYKAESKISLDLAGLGIHVSPENDTGENEAEVIEPDLFTPWERLDPVGQFLRLMERPNPNQTGRQLRQKTQIRIDMAGAAFWYLESPLPPYGLPRGIHGISPARMWKVEKDGATIGWIMDRNKSGGGVPFTAEEILPFMSGSADDDGWGVGVVEAVYSQVPLTDLMARHTADLLASGGRLAGAMWPKDRVLDEGEFREAQNAWRTVASDPNAAKRMLFFPEPMEWAAGASTPADIGIPELATLNRDEILTAFPISPYQLGVPMPGGLNSAETRKEDRRDYWEGTIHPRVELFEEVVQVGLLSRYEAAVGYTLDFEVEEPGLDDAMALLDKAKALRELWNLGFDEQEAIKAVSLDHIKFVARPAPPPQLAQPDMTPPDVTTPPVGKPLKADDIRERREKATIPLISRGTGAFARFFDDQRQRVVARVREMPVSKAQRSKASPDDLWDPDVEDAELRNTARSLYVDVGKAALQVVADQVNRIVRPDQSRPILVDLLAYGADRVTNINEATRMAIRAEVAEGIRRGYSIDQLVDGNPAEGYLGVQKALLDNGVAAFGDGRAETIARTETMLSYNRAALDGYRDFDVREVIAFDGDGDEVCAERNGQTFSIDDAAAIEDHPNGTLDWAPVVTFGEKADPAEVREQRSHERFLKALDVMSIPQPAPVIHNHVEAARAPEVRVEMAPITVPVTMPEIIVPPAVVNVTIPEQKPVKRTVVRDERDRIIGLEEA